MPDILAPIDHFDSSEFAHCGFSGFVSRITSQCNDVDNTFEGLIALGDS